MGREHVFICDEVVDSRRGRSRGVPGASRTEGPKSFRRLRRDSGLRPDSGRHGPAPSFARMNVPPAPSLRRLVLLPLSPCLLVPLSPAPQAALLP